MLALLDRMWKPGDRLRILSVVRPWPFVGDPLMTGAAIYATHLLAEERRVHRDVAEAEDLVRRVDPGIVVDAKQLEGDAAELILAEARTFGADWIVLGAHGKSNAATTVLGSVARRVVDKAQCSVQVVRAVGASR